MAIESFIGTEGLGDKGKGKPGGDFCRDVGLNDITSQDNIPVTASTIEGSLGINSRRLNQLLFPRYLPNADSFSKTREPIDTVERSRSWMEYVGPSALETGTVSDLMGDVSEGVAVCVVNVTLLIGVEKCLRMGVVEVVGEEGMTVSPRVVTLNKMCGKSKCRYEVWDW